MEKMQNNSACIMVEHSKVCFENVYSWMAMFMNTQLDIKKKIVNMEYSSKNIIKYIILKKWCGFQRNSQMQLCCNSTIVDAETVLRVLKYYILVFQNP